MLKIKKISEKIEIDDYKEELLDVKAQSGNNCMDSCQVYQGYKSTHTIGCKLQTTPYINHWF